MAIDTIKVAVSLVNVKEAIDEILKISRRTRIFPGSTVISNLVPLAQPTSVVCLLTLVSAK